MKFIVKDQIVSIFQ